MTFAKSFIHESVDVLRRPLGIVVSHPIQYQVPLYRTWPPGHRSSQSRSSFPSMASKSRLTRDSAEKRDQID